MTVFSRVADILQAKTHKLLNQLEDPKPAKPEPNRIR
jgi:phage shock protein A